MFVFYLYLYKFFLEGLRNDKFMCLGMVNLVIVEFWDWGGGCRKLFVLIFYLEEKEMEVYKGEGVCFRLYGKVVVSRSYNVNSREGNVFM